MNQAPAGPENGADRAAASRENPILSPRPEKAGNRKVSGSFFVSFAQSAVFGAFFMQRMCNLGERAKDTIQRIKKPDESMRFSHLFVRIFCQTFVLDTSVF